MVIVCLVEFLVDQVEHGHLHHTLVEVGGFVLDDLDGDNFLGAQVLAFDDLAESALAEDIEDQVSVSVGGGNVSGIIATSLRYRQKRRQQNRTAEKKKRVSNLWFASSLPRISLTYNI